jgi:hypothetical protein
MTTRARVLVSQDTWDALDIAAFTFEQRGDVTSRAWAARIRAHMDTLTTDPEARDG